MKNHHELSTAKSAVHKAIADFQRQLDEGLISFSEWRNATVNTLVNPAVEAIVTLDNKLIDIRLKHDEAILEAFGQNEEEGKEEGKEVRA